MAKIFISHSSKDKEFVSCLAADLNNLGHQVCLDQWEIKVGECIVTKVEHGISEADYVVVVLSPNSTVSNWIEHEWKAKYWDEINKGQVFILPALIADCEIPSLLRTKKYADFRVNYAIGLVELNGGISPVIRVLESNCLAAKSDDITSEISALIAKIQSKAVPLSQCIAEALAIAYRTESQALIHFCKEELSGLSKESIEDSGRKYSYRLIEGFVTPLQINMQYWGWSDGITNALDFMRNHEDFHSCRFLINFPISKIENQQPDDPKKQLMIIQMSAKQLFEDSPTPEEMLNVYFSSYSFINLLESIRVELTNRLLELLPEAKI